MESRPRFDEEPNWNADPWLQVTELNFMLAMQEVGRLAREKAPLEERVRAQRIAVIAADVLSDWRGPVGADVKLSVFVDGLRLFGGVAGVIVGTIGNPKTATAELWKEQARLAHASVKMDTGLKLSPPEVLHALVHGDPEVMLEVELSEEPADP